MSKYTADIEIAVRGGQQVNNMIKGLNRLNNSINVVNRNAKLLEGKGFNVASMENYSRAVFKAENALRKAAQGTRQEEMAVKALVTAMETENRARARRNSLIAQEVANRRQVIATANAGFGLQGPQAAPIRAGRGPASPIRGTVNMPGSPAALAAGTGAGTRTAARGIASRLPGAISGGIIGGAFPLLFGQGGGAAAGGLAGGVIGGLFGPGGSFAGSLLGTLLGDIASQGQKIKQLGTDIGFSAQQADVLASSFKKVNTDIEKFTGVVQNIRGLGLVLEDQAELIRITTALTEKYGGQFDKVGNAITSALESGKVSQSTLNQLTSQGINVQQALADKLGVSRDRLLEMAKKGEISVQELINTLVDLGNKGVEATSKPASGFDILTKATKDLGTALSALGGAIVKALKPALDWLSGALGGIISLAAQAIQSIATMLSGGTAETVLANARARKRLNVETGAPMRGNLTVKQQERLRELEKEEQASMVKPKPLRKIDVTGLGQAAPTGTGKASDKAEKAAERERQRVAEVVREQRLLTLERQRQYDYSARIFAAETAKDPILARRLQGEQQLAEWSIETSKLLQNELNTTAQLEIVKARIAEKNLIIQKTEQDTARLYKEQRDNAAKTIRSLELEVALRTAVTDAQRQRLQIEYEMQELILSGQYTTPEIAGIAALKLQAAAPLTGAETIKKEIGSITDEIKKLTGVGDYAVNSARAIGAAFRDAFSGLVSGAMTAQEALAGFFKSVADSFAQMAAEIIAKQITMLILQTLLKALGAGGGSGNFNQSMDFVGPGLGGGSTNAFAYGNVPKFADGGIVTRPTMGLIGEGGQPEYVIPASKMRGAMNRYAAGARGSAVIPAGDGGDGGTATMVTAPGAIDVRYTVERINSVDYVTADQFQQGMRQAAQQGAAQGEQRTLRRLQMSTSTRKRLGM